MFLKIKNHKSEKATLTLTFGEGATSLTKRITTKIGTTRQRTGEIQSPRTGAPRQREGSPSPILGKTKSGQETGKSRSCVSRVSRLTRALSENVKNIQKTLIGKPSVPGASVAATILTTALHQKTRR